MALDRILTLRDGTEVELTLVGLIATDTFTSRNSSHFADEDGHLYCGSKCRYGFDCHSEIGIVSNTEYYYPAFGFREGKWRNTQTLNHVINCKRCLKIIETKLTKLNPLMKEPALRLNDNETKFLDFVKTHFVGHTRKYTNEPSYLHSMRVASIVQAHVQEPKAIVVALGHDLIEDTKCTRHELRIRLESLFGFSEADFISACIDDLTNVYTSEAYPQLSRTIRKRLECERLQTIAGVSMSVKCGDVIDNVPSIKQFEPEFAKIYCAEKAEVLKGFSKADAMLLKNAIEVIKP